MRVVYHARDSSKTEKKDEGATLTEATDDGWSKEELKSYEG